MSKIDRSAFLYLSPRQPVNKFAQCGTCALFLPGYLRCAIHGPQFRVTASDSCGLYLHGNPADNQRYITTVTPQESGFVREQVRCENCKWFDRNHCELYRTLNARLPKIFALDEQVEAKGCCNGFESSKSA